MSILVVGNFLRDGESTWLEGILLVVSRSSTKVILTDLEQIIYAIIATASWYYPNPDVATSNGIQGLVTGRNVTIDIDVLKALIAKAEL